MIDPSLLSLARTRIKIDLGDRQDANRREFAQEKESFGARGVLTSSFAQAALERFIAAELDIRARVTWHVLGRVISSSDVCAVAGDLKLVVAESLDAHSDDLKRDLEWTAGLMPGATHLRSFEQLRERALERIDSEIDIACLSAKRAEAGTSSVVNIYQPYGVVQTGAGSSATVTQHFGTEERVRLQSALLAVERALQADEGRNPEAPSDALELIADANTELKRDNPNFLRLRGALMGIATTVQTLGSAAGAYQALKAAAALVGVPLP